jgi:tRNA(fMet)-specific endonuclease VapC
MKRFLLDTGILSDFINHRRGVDARVQQAKQQGARIGTCMPVVAELFGGIELSVTKEKNLKRLKTSLARIVCWPFNRAGAEEFGRIYADLQRRGRLIGPIDMQIAAIALSLGVCPRIKLLATKNLWITSITAIRNVALEIPPFRVFIHSITNP